jgi:drug/metabolite transporter, DME family
LTLLSALVAILVLLASRTLMLWLTVVFTGGIPLFAPKALWVFVGLGVLQSARSLLSFFGLQKIGTSQSQPRRNTYPLWSALFVISFMNEQAGPAVLGGTMLVVLEVALISWQPDRKAIDCCGWHVLYSLGAGILAGVAFPLRLCSLTITKEPVFFAAIVAVVSLVCSLPYAWLSHRNRSIVWHPKALMHFSASGFFEGLGAIEPDDSRFRYRGRGSPIVATTPLWNMLIAYLFLREREKLNAQTGLGTVAVVGGTIAITPGR